jgi:predicted metal-dependent hydrolase
MIRRAHYRDSVDRKPLTRELMIDGCRVPVTLRVRPRARNLVLRLDARTGGAVVTLPPGVPPEDGFALARRRGAWILERLVALPQRVPFAEGAVIPYLGADHRVRHLEGTRGAVWRANGEIHVAGRVEHLPRRLTDWLRAEARRETGQRAHDYAGRLGLAPGRITVRDTRSRWGSCAADGGLSFCWRLILAPEPVLDYVVAHEVAHLMAMDHGPRFWRTVERLVPDVSAPRAWLKRHGASLQRYG